MNNILYVTTFNKKLFNLTGQTLLESYLCTQAEDDLFVVYEDDLLKRLQLTLVNLGNRKFFLQRLEELPWFNSFLQQHKKIIPKIYGGEAELCKCKEVIRYFIHNEIPSWQKILLHEPNCNFKFFKTSNARFFNQKLFLWFKKVLSMNYALEFVKNHQQYKYLIFVDSDVTFQKEMSSKIHTLCSDYDICYHLGEHRKKHSMGIETGFIVFTRPIGFTFLQEFVNIYDNSNFKKYNRWDDSFIMYVLLNKWKNQCRIKDLDFCAKLTIENSNVVQYGLLKENIIHDKGCHFKS